LRSVVVIACALAACRSGNFVLSGSDAEVRVVAAPFSLTVLDANGREVLATLVGPAKTKWTLWSDAETTQAYAALARLHTRLAPYFWTLAAQAHRSGRPLMMHPWLLFPDRPEALRVDDAFFLGPALFAAPVVRRGQTQKQVWLPPGRYVDLRDLSVHEGDAEVALPAPLGELPLLLVDGQILPLLDAKVDTLAPATDPLVVTSAQLADRLDVQVALGAGESAQLALWDGTQLSAQRVPDDAGVTLTTVDPAALGDCSLCFADQPPRLRANSALAADSDLSVCELRLSAHGPTARRIRWDVVRLP